MHEVHRRAQAMAMLRQRWDAQQIGYLPEREARFEAMLDVLEFTLPESFIALDLAAGLEPSVNVFSIASIKCRRNLGGGPRRGLRARQR
jgi:hypothetical protein